jgi:lipid II:glycine glycyltransferase (peptidoglycan interpeptide bridge formation enzyme)
MIIRSLLPKEQRAFNQVVSHPVQTWEWGEFRRAMGVAVERIGVFQDSKLIEGIQVTFHAVPILEGRTLGNFSRGSVPNEHQLAALEQLGAMHNALAIKIEPNTSVPVDQSHRVHQSSQDFLLNHGCKPGKQHFAPYTYTIDLTKSEDALLEQMDPKTRYNVRLAHKKGVAIYENTSKEGMEIFIEILQETTDRQRFYAHTPEYFRTMWQILGNTGMLKIFTAVYQDRVLTAWVMFVHNKVLYYPYGASRSE